MSTPTQDLADWFAAVFLGLSLSAATAIPFVLLVDMDSVDPRPAVRRAAGAVHQVAVHAGHDWNRVSVAAWRAVRDVVLDAAALLILLTMSPKGALR
ncbi:hypothetical protein ACWEPZ_37655 [Streptomyces sp. NPDC004288]|uniref:hypothetical protein n=1 Tax=Streptomyces sp. NPDC005574 TaxID=3156891 RepID=UPI0033B990F6